jgi:hypothetical protein
MIEKIDQMLREKGVILDPLDIQKVCDRFGVKDESQVDDDFIKIILSMVQESPSTEETVKVDIPKVSDHTGRIKELIRDKVEQETDQIVELYKNVPTEVKNKVIKELKDHQNKEKETTPLYQLKNIIDFNVVMAEDEKDSRNFVRQIYGCFFLLSVFLLVFSAIVSHESNQTVQRCSKATTVDECIRNH